MKLSTKTLLFFVGVIVFQSAVTILAITSVTKRINLADARRELQEEAATLCDGFHAWKRQIWISLNAVRSDARLAASDAEGAARWLRELLLVSKVDALVLRDPGAITPRLVTGDWGTVELRDLEQLGNRKAHPYLDLIVLGDALCLVGVTSVRAAGGVDADVFLIKRLDAAFCAQLVLERRSQLALYLGSRYLAGSLPAAPPAGLFDAREISGVSLERYDTRIGRELYNASWQRIGALDAAGAGQPGGEPPPALFLAIFLSSAPYLERLVLLDRTVLVSSVAGAVLTIILSLFLSRNITHPIAELLAGMGQLRAEAWDTRVRIRGGREIGSLFRAFNEMARDLEQSRAALHESLRETMLLKEYNETIVNSIQAGIAIVSRALVVEKANGFFQASFGLDRAVGRSLTELGIDIVDDSLATAVRDIVEGRLDSWSAIKRSARGRVYEIKLYPFVSGDQGPRDVAGSVLVTEDITARTELEEKIFRAEKLASVSVLSAGMAHEINNPLGSILTNVQNLIDEETDPARTVSLKWIEQETRRIARVVQELLRFSASDAGAASAADVNAVIQDVVRMVRHSLLPEGRIRIDTHLGLGLPAATVGADELTQLTVNLVRNSVQAIEGSGRIVIVTSLSPDRRRIIFSVTDTGAGIPEEVLPRIFDPFFTTKANGEGTGLGLSVVYGIVRKYSGTISVRSRVGRGTGMRLGLPCRGEGA